MSAAAQKRELIRETEWMRVYAIGRDKWGYSKFMTDGLEVSAESIKQRWPSFTPEEQFEFAIAFVAKSSLAINDLEILKFLMEAGAEHVWFVIANRLVDYPDRERALSFLLQRAASAGRFAECYFNALQRMGDPRAIPVLRQRYEQYRTALSPIEDRTVRDLLAYLNCLDALWRLDGSREFKDALQELLTHSYEAVREEAQHRLSENALQDLGYSRKRSGPPGRPPQQEEELVKETEWSKVYCGATRYCWRVSKFRTDGLEISAAAIRERWSRWELEEQVEFAQAFCQKPSFTPQDQEMLQILIEEGIEYVRTTTALQLRSYPDQELVVSFILKRIAAGGPRLSNYYEALQWLGDEKVVPHLLQRCAEHRKELLPFEKRGIRELSGYLRCCRTLWTLTGSTDYKTALEEMLSHPDEQVRREVRSLLLRKLS